MKKAWIILLCFPLAGISSDEFFYVHDEKDQDLLPLEEDVSLSDTIGTVQNEETENHSLFEIKEDDELLIPWSMEELTSTEISSFIERRALQLSEEFDEAFAFDLSTDIDTKEYQPIFEKVPEIKSRITTTPIPIQSESRSTRYPMRQNPRKR